MSSDLLGVNPATLNGMLLYYRLMTKWIGLGDSMELSQVGLSHQRCLRLGHLARSCRALVWAPKAQQTQGSNKIFWRPKFPLPSEEAPLDLTGRQQIDSQLPNLGSHVGFQ
jgi:hypothetical protein